MMVLQDQELAQSSIPVIRDVEPEVCETPTSVPKRIIEGESPLKDRIEQFDRLSLIALENNAILDVSRHWIIDTDNDNNSAPDQDLSLRCRLSQGVALPRRRYSELTRPPVLDHISPAGSVKKRWSHKGLQIPPLYRPSIQLSTPQAMDHHSPTGSVKQRWSHNGGEIPSLFRPAIDLRGGPRSSSRSVPTSSKPPLPTRQFSDSQLHHSPRPRTAIPHKTPSKLHAKWPPIRTEKKEVSLSKQRTKGVVPPQAVRVRRSSFEPSRASGSIHDAIKAMKGIRPSAIKNKKKGRRRTNLRLRWGGPTVYLIERIRHSLEDLSVEFHPDLLTEDRFIASLGKDAIPMRADRFGECEDGKDSVPNRPRRVPSLERDFGWYNHDNREKSHSRPDVWVTPAPTGGEQAPRSWRVKRIWNEPEFDGKETEHRVGDGELMDKVKSLLGVTEDQEAGHLVDGMWVCDAGQDEEDLMESDVWGETTMEPETVTKQEENKGESIAPSSEDASKRWGATWVYDFGGEIHEEVDCSGGGWCNEQDVLDGLKTCMDEEIRSVQSIVSIPEDSVNIDSNMHKTSVFERPQDRMSSSDISPRRPGKIKSIDLPKDSEHSSVTELTVDETEEYTGQDLTESAEFREDDLTPVAPIAGLVVPNERRRGTVVTKAKTLSDLTINEIEEYNKRCIIGVKQASEDEPTQIAPVGGAVEPSGEETGAVASEVETTDEIGSNAIGSAAEAKTSTIADVARPGSPISTCSTQDSMKRKKKFGTMFDLPDHRAWRVIYFTEQA